MDVVDKYKLANIIIYNDQGIPQGHSVKDLEPIDPDMYEYTLKDMVSNTIARLTNYTNVVDKDGNMINFPSGAQKILGIAYYDGDGNLKTCSKRIFKDITSTSISDYYSKTTNPINLNCGNKNGGYFNSDSTINGNLPSYTMFQCTINIPSIEQQLYPICIYSAVKDKTIEELLSSGNSTKFWALYLERDGYSKYNLKWAQKTQTTAGLSEHSGIYGVVKYATGKSSSIFNTSGVAKQLEIGKDYNVRFHQYNTNGGSTYTSVTSNNGGGMVFLDAWEVEQPAPEWENITTGTSGASTNNCTAIRPSKTSMNGWGIGISTAYVYIGGNGLLISRKDPIYIAGVGSTYKSRQYSTKFKLEDSSAIIKRGSFTAPNNIVSKCLNYQTGYNYASKYSYITKMPSFDISSTETVDIAITGDTIHEPKVTEIEEYKFDNDIFT